MSAAALTASHYGVVRFGELQCGAVVLTDGSRGYVRSQITGLLGFTGRQRGDRFARFMGEIAPNCLSELQKKGVTVSLPSGQRAQFFPAGIIADLAKAIVSAQCAGRLHKARRGAVAACLTILAALAATGEAALIDEATGYQRDRAPAALQEVFERAAQQRREYDALCLEERFDKEQSSAAGRVLNRRRYTKRVRAARLKALDLQIPLFAYVHNAPFLTSSTEGI